MHAAYRCDCLHARRRNGLSAVQAIAIALLVLIRSFPRLLGFDSAIPERGGDGFHLVIGCRVYRIGTSLGFKTLSCDRSFSG